ncbi:MAG: hypothetical protein KTR32_05470, partial [Granulosicoccus sp.]|nr:hypothetical protein [Granulosicoccus sp.]
ARLIIRASARSQIWIVSHARRLINALEEHADFHSIELHKDLGQTLIRDQREFDEPSWHWPGKN